MGGHHDPLGLEGIEVHGRAMAVTWDVEPAPPVLLTLPRDLGQPEAIAQFLMKAYQDNLHWGQKPAPMRTGAHRVDGSAARTAPPFDP